MSVLDLAPPRAALRPWRWAPAAAGIVGLLARPWFLPPGVGVGWRVAFFVVLGMVGAAGVVPGVRRARLRMSLGVLAVGSVGFALGRAAVDVPLHSSGM